MCGGHTWLLAYRHSRLAAAGGGCGDGQAQDAPPVAVASSEARPGWGVPILSSGCSQRKEEAGAGAGHSFRDIRAPVGTVCILARLPVPHGSSALGGTSCQASSTWQGTSGSPWGPLTSLSPKAGTLLGLCTQEPADQRFHRTGGKRRNGPLLVHVEKLGPSMQCTTHASE